MEVFDRRERPCSWREWRSRVKHAWVVPFAGLEYGMEWAVYALSNWRFLEAVDYLGRFGVLVAVIYYFAGSGDRLKQKHYQAWQVIDLAEGKGGNGGRIEALEELNRDGVPLVGVNLASAFLMGVRLPKARLARANFDAADARGADLSGANVRDASLRSANFRGAKLEGALLERSVLEGADLNAANLRGADLDGANLDHADLRDAELAGVKWNGLESANGANVKGVKNAPSGFLSWMKAHGAVEEE